MADADLFWDDSDIEVSANDMDDVVSNYADGEVVRLQRAVRLSDVFAVRVNGVIRSFDTLEEANAWAEQQETGA